MSERIVVVLGAGASFDVDTGSTPGTDSEWKPPLVSSMFEGRESFYGLRRPYKGARRLAQVLHHRAAAGVLDMERELRALANSPDSITRRDFLDIPPYLRDVMYNVGLPPGVRDARPGGYVVSPGAYALLLHELLVSADSEVAFIVMNYDTLLERSLMEYDPESYKFDSFEDYVEPSRKALVVKPHGSVNWWAPMRQRVANLTWHQALDSISLDDIRSSAARKFHADEIRASHGATAQVDGAQHWMYPLITAPLADKEESDLVCPAEHLEALSSFMQDCGRYLFIGTSGFDTDVLAFMARHMPELSIGEFVFGGDGREAQAANKEARNRILRALPRLGPRPPHNVATQETSDTFMYGFASYLLTRRALTLATLPLDEILGQYETDTRE